MPIKPENRVLYPRNWPEIRAARLAFASFRCEYVGPDGRRCGARHYSSGWWHEVDGLMRFGAHWGDHDLTRTYAEARVAAAELYAERGDYDEKPIVIVLTIAHLDHNPENCSPENLRAMCQRHHLAHDQALHLAHAQETRRAKSGNLELF